MTRKELLEAQDKEMPVWYAGKWCTVKNIERNQVTLQSNYKQHTFYTIYNKDLHVLRTKVPNAWDDLPDLPDISWPHFELYVEKIASWLQKYEQDIKEISLR